LFSDAKKVLQKYSLDKLVPKNVIRHLDHGIKGKIPETPKKAKISNYIIASNNDCLDAMKSCAQDLGYSVKTVKNISANVEDLGILLAKMVSDKKNCVIFGGESTVVVKGKGKGGRNQELVLRISLDLSLQNKNAVVVSVGTDGIDGNTRCAGAMWQSDQTMNDISQYLFRNDSHNFFKKYGGLIFTGHTGTNLLDIGLVLHK
jgi:hydroxypyruvate reductase